MSRKQTFNSAAEPLFGAFSALPSFFSFLQGVRTMQSRKAFVSLPPTAVQPHGVNNSRKVSCILIISSSELEKMRRNFSFFNISFLRSVPLCFFKPHDNKKT